MFHLFDAPTTRECMFDAEIETELKLTSPTNVCLLFIGHDLETRAPCSTRATRGSSRRPRRGPHSARPPPMNCGKLAQEMYQLEDAAELARGIHQRQDYYQCDPTLRRTPPIWLSHRRDPSLQVSQQGVMRPVFSQVVAVPAIKIQWLCHSITTSQQAIWVNLTRCNYHK